MAPSTRPQSRQNSKRQRQLDATNAPAPKRARPARKSERESGVSICSDKENETPPQQQRASPSQAVGKVGRDVRCRAAEVVTLRNTIRTALKTEQGECVYVPGQPGTGKTHTVQSVLHGLECASWGAVPASTFVNCEHKQLGVLGRRIIAGLLHSAQQLRLRASAAGVVLGTAGENCSTLRLPDGLQVRSNVDALDVLHRIATGTLAIGEGMCMVVLDELDRACEKADTFVKELFKLPKLPGSRLIVVGIANRMDLTERLLKGSELQISQRPKLVSFHSYSARQLLELLQERYPSKFEPKALELVAKRVSAASGDMRIAINVCDTAVRAAPHGALGLSSKRADHCGSEGSAPSVITMSQAAEALKQCGSGSSAAAATCIAAIQTLPTQQQLLLCTLAIARGRVAPTPSACATPPGSMPTTPKTQAPLSARFAVLSGLQRTQAAFMPGKPPRTPVLQSRGSSGFGLAGAPSASKSVNKTFPRADDEMLTTPDTAPGTPCARGNGNSKAAASPAAQKSDLPMATVFTKYKAAAKEAGLAALDMAQLQAMASALQECGLLEGRKVAGGKGAASRRLSLAVGTEDVKHALADNRMMQMLVQQLP